ncbi:hypothetical protein QYF61_017901 [Mycteria americana]|uniref:Uncharacterized protein n=1 Tax=Mycteria americana TaxID=33587 RepID=A0AAN7RX92_MYCAM|nr:hypothetical protein QYF61_017901 [Mycteria americana]
MKLALLKQIGTAQGSGFERTVVAKPYTRTTLHNRPETKQTFTRQHHDTRDKIKYFNSCKSTEPNSRACAVQREMQHPVPGEEQPYALIHAGANWLESSLAEKNPGPLVDIKLSKSQWAFEAKKVNGILGWFWRSVASRSRALLSTGETQRHGHTRESPERLRESGPFSLEKPQGDQINVYKYLKGGWTREGTRLYSVVPSDRTSGNGHKHKHRRFPLNIRKTFFTVRVTKPWHRLPRKVVESASLEIFKSHLDTVLSNRL